MVYLLSQCSSNDRKHSLDLPNEAMSIGPEFDHFTAVIIEKYFPAPDRLIVLQKHKSCVLAKSANLAHYILWSGRFFRTRGVS